MPKITCSSGWWMRCRHRPGHDRREPEPQVHHPEAAGRTFYFVGKAGALRFGKTVTEKHAAPDDFKRRLLEETER